ncbi:MAG: MdtA/MuxA family multidrug efflux RND transporter periplasmic adaptor subunit [Desulfovibrio sp.]|jgi:multidrug efflux system membrane fusion protein|nr:MdtA/MuxA family multidrug efflux RND transporter periplasmic adaptor subunit [Desulfovibrio sp.]
MDRKTKRTTGIVLAALIVAGLCYYGYTRFTNDRVRSAPQRPLSVGAARARIDNVDVFLQALGTVSSPNTVTVKSRVDGELTALHFTEGQLVREGDLLAEIDPRPFEVRSQQAKGQLTRDEALLRQAELELERYRKLIKERSVSQQQLEIQEGLVGQYLGAVIAGRAALADAELQIAYSRITAPISGRVGLRKVDLGNMIRSSDSDGLVLITQMRPMHVVFTLVEKQIPEVVAAMFAARDQDRRLMVEAYGQGNKMLLAEGGLLTIDNQIDTATGTVKAKAEFANEDFRLFPNQFVNVRLRVKTLGRVLVIPSSAVQRNNDGFFVYVIEDGVSRGRPIQAGYATDSVTVVESGLGEGDVVVTDGVDRLRDGMPVRYDGQAGAEPASP